MEETKLTCNICGKRFVFSVQEQEYRQSKGEFRIPMQCSDCCDSRGESNSSEKCETSMEDEFKCLKCSTTMREDDFQCSKCNTINDFCPWCSNFTSFEKYHLIKRNPNMSFWERLAADSVEGFLDGLEIGFTRKNKQNHRRSLIEHASEYKYVCSECDEPVFITTWPNSVKRWKEFDIDD